MRRVAGCAALAALILTVSGAPAPAAPGLRRLPKGIPLNLPVDATGEVHIATNPVHRRLYTSISLSQGTLLRSYHLDRLVPVRQRRLSNEVFGALLAVDEKGGRILAPFGTDDRTTGIRGFRGVLALNGETLETEGVWEAPLGPPPSGMSAKPVIWGTTLYVPPRGGSSKLLFFYQDDIATAAFARLVSNPVFVAQWDTATGKQDWAYQVRACRGEMTGRDWEFFRDQASVVLGCVTQENTGLAVRLTLGPGDAPAAEEVFPGPPLTNHVLADPGGRRLVFVVEKDFKESLFLFDVDRSAYVGAVATTRFRPAGVAYALDASSGRLFGLTSDLGVVLADVRRTPAQQALVYPEYARGGGGVIGVERETPGHPRRFFLRGAGSPFLEIFEDRVPVSTDPPLSDLDRFTVNHKEQRDVTDSSFEASAHAYGIRTLLVGGVEGIASGDARRQVRRVGSPCTFYDRELVAGLIPGASLSNGIAFASAVAGDADPGTKTDLEQPASRCWPHPDPFDTGVGLLGDDWPQPGRDFDKDGQLDKALGRPWPFPRLECSGDQNPKPVRDATFTGYVADAACAGSGGRSEAFAQARGEDTAFQFGVGKEPVVRVAEAASKATLDRLPGGGVVVRSEAWARGIEIMGVGYIELVRTVAVSQAAGLPGTAKGSFTPEICGVDLGLYKQKGCDNHEKAIEALNRALGARGRAILRKPDPELARGSPGGFLASVRKDRFEELSDRALNNDVTTQVTGLELLLINDNIEFGRARQIFQFAGVDASTSYGIFLLPTFLPPIVPPLLPPPPPPVIQPPPPPPPPPAPPAPTFEERTVLRRIKEGLAVAVRSPEDAILATLLWAAMGLPLYLATRRRRLGRALRGRP